MNCNDYLAMLATLPVDELAYGHPREHTLECRDCDRVTRVVAERERNMRLALDDVYSSRPAAQIAIQAVESSRRRRIVRFYEVAVGIAMAASAVFFVTTRRIPARNAVEVVSETFRLQCLSPEQAAEVIRPYVSSRDAILLPSSTLGIIRVRASLERIQKARSALDRYDNAAQSPCAVRVIVPTTP
jgi:type II secretory pathway component GspD/PulD (secretin)